MNIRPATAADWQAVLLLLDAGGLPIADLDGTHVSQFLVALDGTVVVGTVAVQPHGGTGLLRSLVVAAGFRREGLGTKLTEAAEIRARTAGLTTLALLTTTAADFFERRGYVRTDRAQVPVEVQASPEFARLCPAGAACLTKTLA